MKLDNTAREVVSHGIQTSTQMTTNVVVLAQLLAANLYSDSLKAALREPICNALDAQLRSGNQDPIEITIPTEWDPTLSIKDTGLGMAHETVIGLFGCVGGSDKRGDNKETGGFGVGKLAPLSYTDTLSVVSVYDGIKSFYNVTKEPANDEDGHILGEIPTINLMATEPTTEPNGVTISFAVKKQDLRRVNEKLASVLRWVDPSLYVVKGLNVPQVNLAQKGDGWGLLPGRSGNIVVMSHVEYRLDTNSMGTLTATERALLKTNQMILFMENGSCAPAMSREELRYTPQTIENIKKVLNKAAVEISAQWQEKMEACTTLWEACLVRCELQSSNIHWNLKDVIRSNLRFNGKPVEYAYEVKIEVPVGYIEKRSSTNVTLKTTWYEKSVYIQPDFNTVFYWDNGTVKNRNQRIKHDLGGVSKSIFIISTKSEDEEAEALNTIAAMGNPPVKMVHKLPEPPKESRPRGSTIAKVFRHKPGQQNSGPDAFNQIDHDVKEGGIYINISNYEPDFPRFYAAKVAALGLGLMEDFDVFAIPASHKQIPERHKGWVHIRDVLKPMAETIWKDKQFQKDLVVMFEKTQWEHTTAHQIASELPEAPIRKNSVMGQIYQTHRKFAAFDSQTFRHKLDLVQIMLNPWKQIEDLRTKAKTVHALVDVNMFETYPLLEAVDKYNYRRTKSNVFKSILDYVNMIDTRRNKA